MGSAKQEVERYAVLASKHGWAVHTDGRGHYVFHRPDGGQPVRVPKTPGRGRSIQNSRQELRRAGLPIPHRGGEPPASLRRKVTEAVTEQTQEAPVEAAETVPVRPKVTIAPEFKALIMEAIQTAPEPQTPAEVAKDVGRSLSGVANGLRHLVADGVVFRRKQTPDEREPGRSLTWLYWRSEWVPPRPRVKPSVAAVEPVNSTPIAVPQVNEDPVPVKEPAPPAASVGPELMFTVDSVMLRDAAGDLWQARRVPG